MISISHYTGALNMIADDSVLIQVYSTVLAGVLIFMTVQRLFEWKELFEEKSSKLLQLRGNAITERETYQEELDRLKRSRRRNLELDRVLCESLTKQFEDAKKRLEGQIRLKDDEFRRVRDDLYSLTGKYSKRREKHTGIKKGERFLNVAMIILMVTAIIVVLVGMPEKRTS
jgi:hypothetical protein